MLTNVTFGSNVVFAMVFASACSGGGSNDLAGSSSLKPDPSHAPTATSDARGGSAPAPPPAAPPKATIAEPTPKAASSVGTSDPRAALTIKNGIERWKSKHPHCNTALDADGLALQTPYLALCTRAITRASTCQNDPAFIAFVRNYDPDLMRTIGPLGDAVGDAKTVAATCARLAGAQFCRSPSFHGEGDAAELDRMLVGNCGDVAKLLLPMLMPGE